MKNKALTIFDTTIQPGEHLTLALPTPELYTCTPMHIPIHIIHGKKAGPCLLVCAALHGDETNGISIVQKLLHFQLLKKLQGTLIAVPVINVYGLMAQQRNLPDRRDLEGSFPGSETGSYAARLAYSFNKEILSKATHCIDLHTGEPHYKKFPQVLTNLSRKDAADLAKMFQAPVIVHTDSKQGFLWQMDREQGIPTLVYQTGEAARQDETGIRIGVKGVLRVLRHLNMIHSNAKIEDQNPAVIRDSIWVRSPGSGLCQIFKKLGAFVKKEEKLAVITDPFGRAQKFQIHSPCDGIVITQNNLPLTNEGEPLMQIAKTESSGWEETQKILKTL